LSDALGPKTIPDGFSKKRFASPKPVVCMDPRMTDGSGLVTRARILDVGNPAARGVPVRSNDTPFTKLAMLLVGTLKFPKL
jgi:hypothetical protein